VLSAKANAGVIRVSKFDTQHKGVADLILLEKSDLTVAIKLTGTDITQYQVIHKRSGITASIKYNRHQNMFDLNYAFATKARYFFNTATCSDHSDLSSLGDLFGVMTATESETINYDQSCMSDLPLKKQISSQFQNLLSNKDKIADCIGQYDNIAEAKWRKLPSSVTKISCDNSNVKYSGVFDSKMLQVRISDKCLGNNNELSSVLKEEILHSFGINNETIAKCAAQCPTVSDQLCKNDIFNKKLKLTNQTQFLRNPNIDIAINNPDGSPTEDVADSYNSAKTIEVPKEIAVAQVPQPSVQDLKMTQSVESYTVTDTSATPSAAANSAATPSTPEAASASSYPNSMMRFASEAILPEKAYAQSPSSNSSATTTSGSSHNTAPSSLSQFHSSSAAYAAENLRRSSTAASRSPASTASLSASSLTTSGATSAAPSATTAAEAAASPLGEHKKSVARGSPSSSSNSSDGTSTSASGAGSSSASTSTGSSANSSAGGGSHLGLVSKQNSFSRRSSRSPASISNSTELTKYFQTTPYREIKQRLQDPQFIQELRQNSTTVFDTQGHQYGAPQGQIIFSDKGNRFVKEK
jgi:hypothetical protein